jgi:hypothetical protein
VRLAQVERQVPSGAPLTDHRHDFIHRRPGVLEVNR